MLSWRNVREGDLFLRVSEDGRFVIRRNAIEKRGHYHYSYGVTDIHRGRSEILGTLQAARRKAIEWAT